MRTIGASLVNVCGSAVDCLATTCLVPGATTKVSPLARYIAIFRSYRHALEDGAEVRQCDSHKTVCHSGSSTRVPFTRGHFAHNAAANCETRLTCPAESLSPVAILCGLVAPLQNVWMFHHCTEIRGVRTACGPDSPSARKAALQAVAGPTRPERRGSTGFRFLGSETPERFRWMQEKSRGLDGGGKCIRW